MRIVNTASFLKSSPNEVEAITSGDNRYTLIANERYVKKSYIIIDPHFLADLFGKIGDEIRKNDIINALDTVTKKVSESYSKRSPYGK